MRQFSLDEAKNTIENQEIKPIDVDVSLHSVPSHVFLGPTFLFSV
jgi:hypothetical protein